MRQACFALRLICGALWWKFDRILGAYRQEAVLNEALAGREVGTGGVGLDLKLQALALTTQTDLLSLNRAGLYYRPTGPDLVEAALKHRIDAIYTDRPFDGSQRMTAPWQREGYAVNRKRIQHYMREMGIWGLAPEFQIPIRSIQSIRID